MKSQNQYYTISGVGGIYKIKKSDNNIHPNNKDNINIQSEYDLKEIKKLIKQNGLNIKYNTITSNVYDLMDCVLTLGSLRI